ncbi:conjugal transfer protein TraF [Rheinheimera hassiensis]|uniref:conjugal transfer protein TraF n=1 Tax=Rheinheimera hassiensis TaxID=1193627 RepID=UPI001F05CE9E|nr:conjugal transfer protein TraF [Rheinheimera hassiensis]
MRILLCVLSILPSLCLSAEPQNWYEQRERGWFWHEVKEEVVEVLPDIVEEQNKSESTSIEQQPEESVALDSAWLKQNLEVLMQKAIDNPSDENIAAYAYANRLLIDLGSRFSTRMKEYMELEQPLQESARRPFSAFALSEFSSERRNAMTDILKAVKDKSHMWFFYSSTCSFCMKQLPVLKGLKRLYDIEILAISMDGGTLPGIEEFEHVFDYGGAVSQRFNVSVTPSMFLVNNNTEQVIPLAQGMHALPELEDRILLVSKNQGLISTEQYALTKAVRDITVFRNDEGEILADRRKLESDPGYLADLLKQRLQEVPAFGVTSIPQKADEEKVPEVNYTPVKWN